MGRCFLAVCTLCCLLRGASAHAQDRGQLPKWAAEKIDTDRLGEAFEDERVRIRPPKGLQRVDRPDPPELTEMGVYSYAWTPGGVYPSVENVALVLAPYARPSSAALDEHIDGMKESVEKGLEAVEFGQVRKGMVGDVEVRAGRFTAEISGEKIVAVYLVGIDTRGTYSMTAMIPIAKATPEKLNELKGSLLTFGRAKGE